MRKWIVAALGAALAGAPVGAAGAQVKVKPARSSDDIAAAKAARAAVAGAHPVDPYGVEVAVEATLKAVRPALADVDVALEAMGPALAAIEPTLFESGPALGAKVKLAKVDGAYLKPDRKLAVKGGFEGGFASASGLADTPPEAWLQADQADSTYREAREALNREQYQRASELFRRIHSRMPRSGYAADALYWDAFALYRAGGEGRLREALGLLDRQAKDYPRAGTRESAATLATRIRGQLAQGGDRSAEREIARSATQPTTCENEDVRIAAINALSQMDAERALPIVRRVLARRDDCSATLREKAVYVVSQHHPADADQILLDVVRNDPSSKVRRQAVYYLGQTKSERAFAALEQLVRTSQDRDVQERALYSLAENGGARGAEVMRAVAESESASESLRAKAIYYLRERRGGDNAAYLRALYPRLNSTKLREQVMYSLAEIGGEENLRWLTAIAMDTTESVKVRSAALYRVSEARGSTAELIALYDRLRGREMRERALYYISQRREAPAAAKLADVLKNDPERPVREKALYYLAQREDGAGIDRVIEVAKSDPDRELRRKAVYYLGQSKDPRAVKALEEIIGQ